MNHITQFKRRTRIMWLIVVLVWVAVLSALGNMAGLPVEPVNADPTPFAHMGLGCITDSECEGLVPAQSDNINLSIREGE